MVQNPNIDYTSTNFEYPVLTRITGQPDYTALKKIKDELQVNATSVPTDLGGGDHGHLGLVLTATEYANISATPYLKPVHPGILTIPVGTAQHAANRL